MFKLTICLIAALLVCAQADNINKNAHVTSEKFDTPDAEGNYNFVFSTSNGISQQASGNAAGVAGEFGFVSQDGQRIQITYTADENGYHPQGDAIPTPHPVPEYILRSLAYIASHSQQRF
ncbi:Edg78E [Drosophila busckii]|uniref:Edg78E n=1 Tax=Drosophila busckii TaxID=30019 RepID=A0A0M3QWI3_DROBS|nr:pupal cuticle protein Edg-78E [Drosophila busckii]ALC44199.1 Edg78E [Drosophila busckii]